MRISSEMHQQVTVGCLQTSQEAASRKHSRVLFKVRAGQGRGSGLSCVAATLRRLGLVRATPRC